jgi:hypothetical protein
MEAICSTEMPVSAYQTTRHHNPEEQKVNPTAMKISKHKHLDPQFLTAADDLILMSFKYLLPSYISSN